MLKKRRGERVIGESAGRETSGIIRPPTLPGSVVIKARKKAGWKSLPGIRESRERKTSFAPTLRGIQRFYTRQSDRLLRGLRASSSIAREAIENDKGAKREEKRTNAERALAEIYERTHRLACCL